MTTDHRLPLAIELAATRVRLLAPRVLLGRLDRRLVLLSGGPRDLPAQRQTMPATLDWSYHLLGVYARRIFGRLGVFVGGATLEAIEVVCSSTERSNVPTDVTALAEQSLIRTFADAKVEPRFGMLETISQGGGSARPAPDLLTANSPIGYHTAGFRSGYCSTS